MLPAKRLNALPSVTLDNRVTGGRALNEWLQLHGASCFGMRIGQSSWFRSDVLKTKRMRRFDHVGDVFLNYANAGESVRRLLMPVGLPKLGECLVD